MADIDKALAGQPVPGAPGAGPDAALTADMALQGIRMAKMMFVLTSVELLGVKPTEQQMKGLTQILPVTETIIRMQKPEAWAKLGEMGSSPWALIAVLVADTALTGFTLWKMMPSKPKDDKPTGPRPMPSMEGKHNEN
jgi:hypothetical protein